MSRVIPYVPGPDGYPRPADYPWSRWFNGGRHELRRGTDFGVALTAMRSYVYAAAAERGYPVRVTLDPSLHEGTLFLEPRPTRSGARRSRVAE